MKTKAFITLTALLLSLVASSHPVVQRTKSCGGWFGYQYVSKQLIEHGGSSTGWGWSIDCTGRGFSRCPKSGHSTMVNDNVNDGVADSYDLAIGEDLVDLAESNISNGTSSGTATVTKRISGQSFSRVYTVRWSSTAVTCSAEDEDPLEVQISVDVRYVAI